MKKLTTVYLIFLYSAIQLVSGCVFDIYDPDNFYSQKYLNNTREVKENALLRRNPGYKNDIEKLMKDALLAAGPFDIADVESHSDDPSSYNHKKQGVDWPQNFTKCGGSKQSPVDIIREQTSSSSLPKLRFEEYTKVHPNMHIVNNGHTVDITGPWGRTGTSTPKMSGGPLKGTYQLLGVHFHWGYNQSQGSEHVLSNSPGVLEMHFVHFNTQYPNASAAIASNDSEALAVVGIIFKPSLLTSPQAKPMFTTLDQAVEGGIIFPALFPLDIIDFGSSYYTYEGSLTTPPCNEIVRWIVVEKPMNINVKHLNVFMKFKKDGHPIEGNYRLTQALNGRKIIRRKY